MIEITAGVRIAEEELSYTAARSGGPGGQNVNKVNSRVTVAFNVERCARLDADHKARIRQRLGRRISGEGVLRVVAQEYRTQEANRKAARERLAALLRAALAIKKVRQKTVATAGAKRRRLAAKKQRGALKKQRGAVAHELEE